MGLIDMHKMNDNRWWGETEMAKLWPLVVVMLRSRIRLLYSLSTSAVASKLHDRSATDGYCPKMKPWNGHQHSRCRKRSNGHVPLRRDDQAMDATPSVEDFRSVPIVPTPWANAISDNCAAAGENLGLETEFRTFSLHLFWFSDFALPQVMEM